jgi:hypothetical protein
VLSVACRRKVQAENFFITDSAQVWLKAMGSAVASLNARVADFNR